MTRTKAEQHSANIRRAKLVVKVEDMSLKEMCDYLDANIPEFPVVIINGMKNQARKNGDNLYNWILRQTQDPKTKHRRLHENQEELYGKFWPQDKP
jgi:hypothetical protein